MKLGLLTTATRMTSAASWGLVESLTRAHPGSGAWVIAAGDVQIHPAAERIVPFGGGRLTERRQSPTVLPKRAHRYG